MEFTVLRHKITVLAPFYSYPTTDLLVPSQNACSMTCVRSCCRASNLFAIHCKHDRFCSQVQVAMYRMQMLLHLRHFWQRWSVAVLWRLWSGIPHVLSVSTSCVTSRGLLVVPLMHSWISSPWLSSLSDRYKSRSYPCYCCGIQRLGRLIRRIRRVFARAHSYSIIRLTPANFLRKKKKRKRKKDFIDYYLLQNLYWFISFL